MNTKEAHMFFGPNRYICDTLSEMRASLKVLSVWNISRTRAILMSLIEENQMMANRMEAALGDLKDLKNLDKDIKAKKAKLKKLEDKLGDDDDND